MRKSYMVLTVLSTSAPDVINDLKSFSPIKYDVKFIVDGEEYATKTVEYNGTVIPPVRPEKDGYVFMGWDGSYKNVTSVEKRKVESVNADF